MTKEDTQATIAALLEERRGYVVRSEDERVAQVDAQLRALGHGAKRPSERASSRPSQKKAQASSR